MAKELSFVLIDPYTISKSRTGGVIARYIGRTDLELAAARIFGPSRQLAEEYAESVRHSNPAYPETCALIADYVLRNYTPDASTGKPRRVMLLLFEGEDAIRKIWQVTGSATLKQGSGQTVRDTYGDYVLDSNGRVLYFEPAVLVPPTTQRANDGLRLWARYSKTDGGMMESATDVPAGESVEKTLVLLKPDNFRYPSFRPGNIIDLLSSSGLRIVAVKKFHMTVAQAEDFYGPVRDALRQRFWEIGAARAAAAIQREFGFLVPESTLNDLCNDIGPLFARIQFENIVKFMTGYNPSECKDADKARLGSEGCLAIVYEGLNAVDKIRSILGATDPSKAKPGSVRREFGSDIMMNAAHASDSVENALRELRIINVEDDTIKPLVEKYYGNA